MKSTHAGNPQELLDLVCRQYDIDILSHSPHISVPPHGPAATHNPYAQAPWVISVGASDATAYGSNTEGEPPPAAASL